MWQTLLNVSLMIVIPLAWGVGMALLLPRLRRKRQSAVEEFTE